MHGNKNKKILRSGALKISPDLEPPSFLQKSLTISTLASRTFCNSLFSVRDCSAMFQKFCASSRALSLSSLASLSSRLQSSVSYEICTFVLLQVQLLHKRLKTQCSSLTVLSRQHDLLQCGSSLQFVYTLLFLVVAPVVHTSLFSFLLFSSFPLFLLYGHHQFFRYVLPTLPTDKSSHASLLT